MNIFLYSLGFLKFCLYFSSTTSVGLLFVPFALFVFSYDTERVPSTLAWIGGLKAQQAREQFVLWGIEPSETLE